MTLGAVAEKVDAGVYRGFLGVQPIPPYGVLPSYEFFTHCKVQILTSSHSH